MRYRNGLPIAHDPDSWPRLAEILRLNPEEKRTFEARVHAACASDDDKSPCWHTPILVREDVSRLRTLLGQSLPRRLSGFRSLSLTVGPLMS